MRSSAAVMSWRPSQVLASQRSARPRIWPSASTESSREMISWFADLAGGRELGSQVGQHLGAFRADPVHPPSGVTYR
jgi:hypothetical protein